MAEPSDSPFDAPFAQALPESPAVQGLSVTAARAAMRAAIAAAAPRHGLAVETVPLGEACGRVLAADLVAPFDVPTEARAAMDGYAFGGTLPADQHPLLLRVARTVMAGAGAQAGTAHAATDCVRAMTGAALPAGLHTVVPFELCERDGDLVRVPAGALRAGANVRGRGSDIAAGETALPAGRVLSAADLGLLASLGVAEVVVRRRLKVALLSTGDELVPVGQPLRPGQAYDSNRVALAALLRRLGCEVLDLGSLADDDSALEAALRRATASADVVITSGGVSGGDADHTRAVLARLGQLLLWQVAMRPGRPFAFGRLHGDDGRRAWLFALPGTPVAALVCVWMLVREPLLTLSGAAVPPLPLLTLPAATAIAKKPGRTEFVRGCAELASEGGGWHVRACADQGGSALRALSQANALIVLDDSRGPVAAGEPVPVHLFDGLP